MKIAHLETFFFICILDVVPIAEETVPVISKIKVSLFPVKYAYLLSKYEKKIQKTLESKLQLCANKKDIF